MAGTTKTAEVTVAEYGHPSSYGGEPLAPLSCTDEIIPVVPVGPFTPVGPVGRVGLCRKTCQSVLSVSELEDMKTGSVGPVGPFVTCGLVGSYGTKSPGHFTIDPVRWARMSHLAGWAHM